MDTGSAIDIHLGVYKCQIVDVKTTRATCITAPSKALKSQPVQLNWDNKAVTSFFKFAYVADPVVFAVTPEQGITSGGIKIAVKGKGFDAIQEPKLILYHDRNEYASVSLLPLRVFINLTSAVKVVL